MRPRESQRDHAYANEVGLPDQLPCDVVKVLPTIGVPLPLITGGAVLVGAAVTRDTAVVRGAVVVGTGRVSHHLTTPGSGSPKTVLLQATPPVNVLGLVKVPFAP